MRIKNIISYHKKSTLVSVICVVLIFVIICCMAVKPSSEKNKVTTGQNPSIENEVTTSQGSPVENEVASNQSYAEYIKGATKYESLDKLKDEYLKHWMEKLGTEEVYCGNYGVNDSEELSDGVIKKTSWISYFTVDENLIPTVYQTNYDSYVINDEIYVCESTDYDFSRLDDPAQLENMISIVGMKSGEYMELWNNEPLGVSEYKQALWIKENASLVYNKLQNPITAFETWLHIEGKGKGEFYPDHLDNGFVKYEFPQGATITAYMEMRNGIYDILYIDNSYTTDRIEQDKIINEYLSKATAQRLISDSKSKNDYEYDGELKDEYILLSEFADEDAAFYGLVGADGIVLRVKDKVYPIRVYWDDGGVNRLSFYINDYDSDGQDEYAMVACTGRGTGCYIESLYILEVNGQDLDIKYIDIAEERMLFDKISDSYDETTGEVSMKIDGKTVTTFNLPKDLFDDESTYECFAFGDIMGYTEYKGQLYMYAEGGLKYKEYVSPDYSVSVNIIAPVSYKADGSFELGNISFQNINIDNVENVQRYQNYQNYSNEFFSFTYPEKWSVKEVSMEDGTIWSVYDENDIEQLSIDIFEEWRIQLDVEPYRQKGAYIAADETVAGLPAYYIESGEIIYLFKDNVRGYKLRTNYNI